MTRGFTRSCYSFHVHATLGEHPVRILTKLILQGTQFTLLLSVASVHTP